MSENIDTGLLVRPWRQAYETRSFFVWSLAATYQATFPFTGYVSIPAAIAAVICIVMAVICAIDINNVLKRRLYLFESNLLFVRMNDFLNKVDAMPNHLYLGEGWDWKSQHTQWVYDLQRSDIESLAPPPLYVKLANLLLNRKGRFFETFSTKDEAKTHEELIKKVSKARKDDESRISITDSEKIKSRFRGLTWMHGIDQSRPIYFPIADAKGNFLITGTTRSGKTVFYRSLISQLARRKTNGQNECLIIIDPKGDKDLFNVFIEAAKREGRLDDVVFFHLAQSEFSHRIDPLTNYNQASQLASRIEPLIPSTSTNGDPFTKFSWGVMESIFSGMDMINIKPSLMALRGIIEKGTDDLLYRCILKHCETLNIEGYKANITAYEQKVPQAQKALVDPKVQGAVNYYKEVVKGIKASPAIDGVVGFFEHNREHASKMLASLMPVLKSLTTGSLASLLSPDANDGNDPRPITSFDSIIRQAKICYIGLDAMADLQISQAVGSIFISDLVFCAANRYSHGGTGNHPVNFIVDEASNCLNKPYIELLNKSAGANFRNFAATQTIPDLEVALGVASIKDKAVGNFNNVISLRVIDGKTKEFIAGQFPPASIRTAQITQNTSTLGSGDNPLLYNGTYGTRTTDSEAPLIEEATLGMLPDLEFVGMISAGRVVKVRIPLLQSSALTDEMMIDLIPWVSAAKEKGLV